VRQVRQGDKCRQFLLSNCELNLLGPFFGCEVPSLHVGFIETSFQGTDKLLKSVLLITGGQILRLISHCFFQICPTLYRGDIQSR